MPNSKLCNVYAVWRDPASTLAFVLVVDLQGTGMNGRESRARNRYGNQHGDMCVVLFDIKSRGALNWKQNKTNEKNYAFWRVLGYLRASICFFSAVVWLVGGTYSSRVRQVWRARLFRSKLNIFSILDCCDAAAADVLFVHLSIEYYFGAFNS